jgi:hypothetical protein
MMTGPTVAVLESPSFVNDTPWRIDVEPAQGDWDAPHHREALAG